MMVGAAMLLADIAGTGSWTVAIVGLVLVAIVTMKTTRRVRHHQPSSVEALAADVVIALGTRLGPFGTLPQHGLEYWPTKARIIQIDADPKALGLVKKVTVGICGDAGQAAAALTERLGGVELACDATRQQRAATIADEKAAWEAELEEWTHEKDPYSLDMIAEAESEEGNWLHPRQVLRELERALPTEAMVSTDIGNINSVAHSYLRFERPRSLFAPMSFGNCGYSLPTMIGAKVAAPDRPAVAYAGDRPCGRTAPLHRAGTLSVSFADDGPVDGDAACFSPAGPFRCRATGSDGYQGRGRYSRVRHIEGRVAGAVGPSGSAHGGRGARCRGDCSEH